MVSVSLASSFGSRVPVDGGQGDVSSFGVNAAGGGRNIPLRRTVHSQTSGHALLECVLSLLLCRSRCMRRGEEGQYGYDKDRTRHVGGTREADVVCSAPQQDGLQGAEASEVGEEEREAREGLLGREGMQGIWDRRVVEVELDA